MAPEKFQVLKNKIEALGNTKVDQDSLRVAYAKIPLEMLKASAQKMREIIASYGHDHHNQVCYDAMLYVIQIVEPEFDTELVEAT